jgi:hypothetical protein
MYDLIIAITVVVCLSLIITMYYFKTKQTMTLSYAVQEAPAKQPAKQPVKPPTQKPVKPPAQKPVQQPAQKPVQQPVKPPTQKPVQKPPTQKPVQKPPVQKPAQKTGIKKPKENVPIYNPPFGIGGSGVGKLDKKDTKKIIEQQIKKYGPVPSNNQLEILSKDISNMTKKLNLSPQQYKEFVSDYAKAHGLLKGDAPKIIVNGTTKNIFKDLNKNLKQDRNFDVKDLYNTIAKQFMKKGGNMSTSDYNSFLNSINNLGNLSQSYRIPIDPKYKTKNDIRYDINQALKNSNIPVSSSAGSAVRKYLSNVLSNYNIKDMPISTYNSLLGNFSNSANGILDKLDDKMARAVKTLNSKNSSGKLPDNSNYKNLVSSGLIYFNKDTGAWSMTQKGKQVNKALTVNNMPVTNSKVYNDVSNYLKQNGITSGLENRVQQAIQTLNAKNSSGKLPSDSSYKDLVHNGLVYFNKNTGAWTVTQKGKDIPKYLNNSMSNNVSNYLETLSGNLSPSNYSLFLNNMVNGQYNASMYLTAPSQKSLSQIKSDVTNTLAKYYNVDTSKINPVVTNMLTNYVSQRDLTKLDPSEYRNLMNGVVKGYGLGNNTLTPVGQGLAGRITIDNQQVPPEKLQADVSSVVQQVYAVRPDLVDSNITNEVLTYLNTKGGNVSTENYNDLLTGLVRGYGIGNGTLSPNDIYTN